MQLDDWFQEDFKISTHVELPKNNNPSFCFAIFYSKEWIDKNFYDFSIN